MLKIILVTYILMNVSKRIKKLKQIETFIY
jgi:hypothetical protein